MEVLHDGGHRHGEPPGLTSWFAGAAARPGARVRPGSADPGATGWSGAPGREPVSHPTARSRREPATARATPLVAGRRHLPGLRPLLRRPRRRRRWRHRRHPQPAAVPLRPRCRRAVGHPVLPLPAERRRLRRVRLPPGRPDVRRRRRRRVAGARGARAGAAGADRHRAEPHLLGPPLVPRGDGLPARVGRLAPLPLRARARGRRPRGPQRLDERVRRSRLVGDPRRRRRPQRLVVPAPVRRLPAGPELGERRGASGVPRASWRSGSTAASTASGSTSPTAW